MEREGRGLGGASGGRGVCLDGGAILCACGRTHRLSIGVWVDGGAEGDGAEGREESSGEDDAGGAVGGGAESGAGAVGQTAVNPIMQEMGKSGGAARAVRLPPERRREIARLGGLARASGKKKEGQ